MALVGIVTVLGLEARTLGGTACFAVRRCGVGGSGCAAAVRDLAEKGCAVIVSWGMAGGISTRVRAGDLCVPERVLAGDGRSLATHGIWRERLRNAAGDRYRFSTGPLLHSDTMVADSHHKRRLGAASGADAVDMESLPIGEACAARGVPFLVVRAVVDQLDDPLPGDLDTVIAPGGGIRAGALLRRTAGRPGQWRNLGRLARRYRRARTGLAAAAEALSRCAAEPA